VSCNTCSHWALVTDAWDAPKGWGRCGASVELWEMTQWDEDYETQVIKPEYENTMMCACDGSSYRADVYTRPDFFCAMEFAQ